MGISQAGNNVLGAVGGVVLCLCLVPQLYRMYKTRSAKDLSYSFLCLFIVGLVLTVIYLIFEGAVSGWVSITLELALAVATLAGKIYLDTYGPYASSKSTNGLSIHSRARMDVNRFLAGTAAPFPLLEAEPRHAAAHLLLDCKLALNSDNGEAVIALSEFADMLESSLENVGELDIFKRHTHSFPSFKQMASVADNAAKATAANLCFIPCKDGFVTAMWLSESSTLAVDFVGAAPETITGMSRASEAFCKELSELYPGSKILASVVSRLPSF